MKKLLIAAIASVALLVPLAAYADDDGSGSPHVCYSSLVAMADALERIRGQAPLVGAYKGKDRDHAKVMYSLFVNQDDGTWTLTRSDNVNTCGVAWMHDPDVSGVEFDMEYQIERSRRLNAPGEGA